MKVKQLISVLSFLDQEKEIMILDSFNGAGIPRTINLGPSIHEITKHEQEECSDCEELEPNQKVYVLGFGFY